MTCYFVVGRFNIFLTYLIVSLGGGGGGGGFLSFGFLSSARLACAVCGPRSTKLLARFKIRQHLILK
jgi:hypothetical protein